MVFVWSQLTKREPNYTLVQVSINDIIMVFAFAPLAALLLGITNIIVPWETLLLSVFLYVITPLIMGISTRKILMNKNHSSLKKFSNKIEPFSIIGLLFTVILLFAFQGETIIAKPIIILLIAIPLILQSYGIFPSLFYFIASIQYENVNFIVAISIFGLNSGAALATVVGVLVEVPVMLTLVAIANKTKHKFQN